MLAVTFGVDGLGTQLECRAFDGREGLGEVTTFELTLHSTDPVPATKVVGKACELVIESDKGARAFAGIVTAFTAIAATSSTSGRRYRATVRSNLAVLELTRRTRIFQKMTVPDIIKKVVSEYAFKEDHVKTTGVVGTQPPRKYCVQYAETDLDFVRRLCEEEGLYFRFDVDNGAEVFVLENTSSKGPELPYPILLAKHWGSEVGWVTALDFSTSLQRRTGKVTLRDYNYENPKLPLQGQSTGGTDLEKNTEIYDAPGRFMQKGDGDKRAELRLQSLRADSSLVAMRTNAIGLATGMLAKLQLPPGGSPPDGAPPEGEYFAVRATHHYVMADLHYRLESELIPKAVPYRLPYQTPRPYVHGIHTARVTGAPGDEIHTDKLGRVTVKFPFDREGPEDDKSSLDIRTLQQNMPGSMIIPRVGWEVMVAFEDGDPDRPYVLGRTYNALNTPPQSLPKNKTMTSVGTYSSPGAAKQNLVQFDDAAGRQHLTMGAAFGMSTSVANNMFVQTAKNENIGITGSQSTTVGGKQDVSVTQAYLVKVGSQSATVGATQKIWAKGDMKVGVGSETVMVGAALLEKVGDPVAGAKALAQAAVMQGVSSLGQAGAMFMRGYSLGQAAAAGAARGGAAGAARGVGGALLGMGVGMIPGADAIQASVQSASAPAPWNEQSGPAGAQAAGGGATGSTDSTGAGGAGPGHRVTNVKGAMTELIGASYNVLSPGKIAWKTTGASTFLVGGSHNTKTAKCGTSTMGASIEDLGSLKIDSAGPIARAIKGAMKTTISGALKSDAGAKHTIDAGAALTFKVGGSLKLDGGHVTFKCGDSVVSMTGSGFVIESSTIKLQKPFKQSGTTGHG